MADIYDWSTTASSNGTIDGINVSENCPPANINNSIRSMAAIIRNSFSSALQTFLAGSAPLPIANGGTNSTSVSGIRFTLGIKGMGLQDANAVAITGGTISGLSTPLPVASGGTGAATAAAALAAIGGLSATAFSSASPGYVKLSNGLILQWGSTTVSPDSSSSVTFPQTLTSWCVPVVSAVSLSGSTTNSQNTGYVSNTLSTLTIWNADDRTVTVPWFAIGV